MISGMISSGWLRRPEVSFIWALRLPRSMFDGVSRLGHVALIAGAAAMVTGCGGSGSSSSPTDSSSSTTEGKSAIEVLHSLNRAGLPIGGSVNYTAATDDNHLLGRPGQYVSKVNFRDTRLKAAGSFDIDGGGSIETFNSKGDANKRYGYVHAITSGSPLFAEYEYLKGTALLRLSHYLTPNQAAAYQRAFNGG